MDFEKVTLTQDKLLSLHGQTQKVDGGFIHFERIYTIEDGVMIRLSMGSFDRPEHLYILIQNNEVSYYRNLPLKSKSNLFAHKFLDKVFHG